jgi:NADH-quinone oxidoreductase subunit N
VWGVTEDTPRAFLGSAVLIDDLSRASFLVISFGTFFTLLACFFTTAGKQLLRFELLTLLFFSSAGLMVMCAAGEFLSFFIGLEITSLSLYVLVGYQRRTLQSLEACVKYFILGAVAAALFLMGVALIYAHIGTLRFADLHLLPVSASHPFAILGLLCVFCALAFKLAIAPFHAWAPDVYQGANSHLTGYMASLVKLSVAIVFLRILSEIHFSQSQFSGFFVVFWLLAAISIAVGSLFGLVHNSVKRMLAYSSVANAGYFCLAFAVLTLNPHSLFAKQALVSYAVIYAILSLGAFTVIAWIEDSNREDLLKEELAGLCTQKPWAAVCLSIFLLGFAGIPPLAGFFAKFFLLFSAISQGLIGLSCLLVVFSCVSLSYYLSVLVEMWFQPRTRYSVQNHQLPQTNSGMFVLVLVAAAAVLWIGVVGPRWAMDLNYVQASEKNLRLGKKPS